MQYSNYDQLISRLKQIRPEPASAGGLTDNIMNSISTLADTKRKFILLRGSQSQWLWFNGFRIITTAAAVFLIGFFLLQQMEINKKLNQLGEQVSQAQFDPGGFNQKGIAELQRAGLFLPDTVSRHINSPQTDMLQVNRRSLNFMLQRIQQLENENISFREKLQKYATDSLMVKSQNEKK